MTTKIKYVYLAWGRSEGPMTFEEARTSIDELLRTAELLKTLGFLPNSSYKSPKATGEQAEYLTQIDDEMLRKADAVLWLTPDSPEAREKVEHAHRRGIPVYNSIAELCEGSLEAEELATYGRVLPGYF